MTVRALLGGVISLGVLTGAALAQEAAAPVAPADPGVVVERFEFRYGLAHPELPPVAELNQLPIRLDRDAAGVWRPAAGMVADQILTLDSIPPDSRFDAEALRKIAEDVVRWFNARDLYGVWVAFQDLEATSTGITDRRAANDHTAHLVIWASQVAEVRTLARGQRFEPQESVNNRKHRGIVSHSPLQAAATPDQPGSLFRQDVLNEYLRGLSQHPGRLVEASIASAGDPGKVVLDYLVNESKPWQVFTQVTNFGTEATGVWRGRLGFQHNQLTNHDDILNVDAITTVDFKTYGSFISYRIPVIRPSTLLARVYGSYGDFLATDASIDSLRFAGRNWLVGAELTNRTALPGNWQVVSALGANFAHYGIQSRIIETPLITGDSEFLIPFFSATFSRESEWWATAMTLRYEQTVGDFANTNISDGIPALGRLGADADWSSVRWNISGTMFMEQLFAKAGRPPHLANELSFRTRGRILTRGDRLIPHEQEPLGGAFSVRGYPESVLSADEFVTATLEYAVHFPRMFQPGEPGQLFGHPFKWRPAKTRQNPDWDLIGRVFFDYAYRQVTPLPLEAGQTEEELGLIDRSTDLAGAGVGFELLVKQNFTLRCDLGVALLDVRDETLDLDKQLIVSAGDGRLYVSTSYAW